MLDIWIVTDTYDYETHCFSHITESGARKNAIERIVSILNVHHCQDEMVQFLGDAGIRIKYLPEDGGDPGIDFEGMELEDLRNSYQHLASQHWDISNFSDVGCVEVEHTRLQP